MSTTHNLPLVLTPVVATGYALFSLFVGGVLLGAGSLALVAWLFAR